MANRYPRVNTKIVAKTRTPEVIVENPRIPILFATIVANKGPYKVTKVRSITEFREIYGDLDYTKQGQDVLNLYQWLAGNVPHNGYAWIKRIEPAFVEEDRYEENLDDLKKVKAEKFGFDFVAKEPGNYYKDYEIVIEHNRFSGEWVDYINISVFYKGVLLSDTRGINKENYVKQLELLEYFTATFNGEEFPEIGGDKNFFNTIDSNQEPIKKFTVNTYTIDETKKDSGIHDDLTIDSVFDAIKVYYKKKAPTELEDVLSYPISIILDGNYPVDLKQTIIDFINDVRDDVHFILTRAVYKSSNNIIDKNLILDSLDRSTYLDEILKYDLPEMGNVSVYAPDILRVEDPLLNDYVNVSSIYELATKIPFNDRNYGIWWNFTGTKRGIVYSDVLHTNTSKEKSDYVKDKTNYIEKTDRDQCFMLQRTTGKKNTAYEQLHASRLTQYLRREIRWIGRKYLFEYNDIDATTYSDCKNEVRNFLNKFANIAIDMSKPYELEVFKTSETSFAIQLTKLKYKDVVESVDLYIELE